MAKTRLKIVYEDNHLLVVAKPAGTPTMGAEQGVTSVVDLAKTHLAEKYRKPGAVFLGVVSRLDAPVTGLLLFARTSKAAGRLTEAFKTRRVEKRYLATVSGEPPPCDEPLVHFLKKDDRNARVFATQENADGAQRAELTYRVLAKHGGRCLVEVELLTGRKHQIRVQLAKIGCPILGDQKYGGELPYKPGIALHAWRLALEHPVRREAIAWRNDPAPRWGYWPEGRVKAALRAGAD